MRRTKRGGWSFSVGERVQNTKRGMERAVRRWEEVVLRMTRAGEKG